MDPLQYWASIILMGGLCCRAEYMTKQTNKQTQKTKNLTTTFPLLFYLYNIIHFSCFRNHSN